MADPFTDYIAQIAKRKTYENWPVHQIPDPYNKGQFLTTYDYSTNRKMDPAFGSSNNYNVNESVSPYVALKRAGWVENLGSALRAMEDAWTPGVATTLQEAQKMQQTRSPLDFDIPLFAPGNEAFFGSVGHSSLPRNPRTGLPRLTPSVYQNALNNYINKIGHVPIEEASLQQLLKAPGILEWAVSREGPNP